jgi:rRNA-processing protein FCF1
LHHRQVDIPDANVLIHGKALCNLPWEELGRDKIEVLYVAPVIQEIDKLKNQHGKQNKLARELSSEVRALFDASNPTCVVRKLNPEVTKRLELRSITEQKFPSLKLDHADQALINYALHIRDEGHDVLLLTDDTICAATSRGHGLLVKLISEHWKRDPEPDEIAKENAKLKGEVQRLKKAEPEVSLRFCQVDAEPLEQIDVTVTMWPAMTADQVAACLAEIRQHCPPANDFGQSPPAAVLETAAHRSFQSFGLGSSEVWEPPTEDAIKKYQTETYPEWLESVNAVLTSLHDRLVAQIHWPEVRLVVSNDGTRPATDVVLRIATQGALILSDLEARSDETEERQKICLTAPPKSPRGRFKVIDPFGMSNLRGLTTPLIDFRSHVPDIPSLRTPRQNYPDEFYWRTRQRLGVNFMEIECASWRHADREIIFRMEVLPNRLTGTEGVIEVSVHATNISEPKIKRLPIRIKLVEGSTLEKARVLVQKLVESTQIRLP